MTFTRRAAGWTVCLLGMATTWTGVVRAGEPMHVTYLWHMHQPIYYPYESVQTTDGSGRFNFSIAGVINDRTPNYTSWPKDAVQQGSDRGMAHAGAQCSFTGSLAEDLNGLWGSSWNGDYRWARNGLRTSFNNPRLDMVGIPYHHSLMPLTCKESMKMQIRLHKEQYKDLWNTGGDYSKGFWPPECAFAEWIIPALVEEGMQWVIVDNGHLFRAVEGFPWNSGSSCRPNPAEVQNPSAAALGSQWVQLQNVWAPTKVLAPWAYQPHYVQYVNPASGAIQRIVAVPAGRYEGNENGRGGYGAFKPENVWGSHVGSVNTDAQHPMLLLCHSDGDNFGMKNADAWNGQHGSFLGMCQSNPDFENTSVQDYLQMYPPAEGDVIHVEPGSWVGIDGGTPYFEKWLSSTYVNGENPDHWSWSVLVAAQNHVLLAEKLENSYSMNDVEWGIGSDTAKAWHWYLNGETSCYWYWDMDRGNPWDGNVTRACNAAVQYADAVLARHAGVDTQGPSIFPPQRSLYNPGGYMWNESAPATNSFDVWSYVYDSSDLDAVRLYWRSDRDGRNPLSSIQNETYSGGAEVNAWNVGAMAGDWDPAVKGPDNIVPTPTRRAQRYKAAINGQNNVLLDYFVEAVDTKGNTNRSDIMHVFVGLSNVTSAVSFTPAQPQEGELLVTRYNASGGPLAAASPVYLKITFDGFATAASNYVMQAAGIGSWVCTNAIPMGTTNAVVYFRGSADESGAVDNSSGANWAIAVARALRGPDVTFNPAVPDGCNPVEITYAPNDGVLAGATQVCVHIGFNAWQGVLSPDPVMTRAGAVWKYSYSPPAGSAWINCCFNNGGSVWDSNSGANYGVGVSNCTASNAVVIFTPAAPRDYDTNITVTFNPAGRSLASASNVYIMIDRDGLWRCDPMIASNGVWVSYGYGVLAGQDTIRAYFQNAAVNPSVTDGTMTQYWSVAVSAGSTNGPSTATFDPANPNGCGAVTILYTPNEGPLKGGAQVNIHIGHNNWQDATDSPMTKVGSIWRHVYTPPAGTELINCCFNDGAGTWDNHSSADWSVPVQNCTGGVAQAVALVQGSPVIGGDPTLQNTPGDNFGLNLGGGYASTRTQGGFGSFGRVYINYDAYNFYVGGIGLDMVGSNNAMVVFLGFNSLPDNAYTLWDLHGLPNGLEYLHNLVVTKPMDVAIVLGDEWGDGTYPDFNLGDGYNFGEGVYYLSTASSSFWPVAEARLSQFDGAGTTPATSGDDDGNALTDRWVCRIPWSSLGATNGIGSITNCWLAGVIVSTSTNGNDRYISGNYLGALATPSTNGNYGFSVVTLDPIEVEMPTADSDGDGIPDEWEYRYFSGLGIAGADSDWDGDSMRDGMEFRAGTNPKDLLSCLTMHHPERDAGTGGLVISWASESNKVYDLLMSTNLADNVFDPIATDIPATPPLNLYTDVWREAGAGFYRARVQP
jgi:hypothetical protein